MAGVVGLGVHAALEEPLLGLFAAVAAAVMALSLILGRAGGVAPALVIVAAGYASTLVVRDAEALDAGAPLLACALLLVAELAYWSIELAGIRQAEARTLLGRLAALLALAVVALGLAAGVLVATAVPLGGGLVWNLVGVAAAAGAIAVIARLAVSAER